MTRAIADHGRTIRVPVHMGDQINKLLRTQHQLTQRLGREPSWMNSPGSDVPPKKVENMIQVARRPLSLETPTDDEEDSVLGISSKTMKRRLRMIPPPTTAARASGRSAQFAPTREVRILQLRYGLLDGQAYTLEEVGRKWRHPRARAPDRGQALSRLRHPTIRRNSATIWANIQSIICKSRF